MRTAKVANFVLDSTLRYLYIALRNIGAQLLAIEFEHRGKRWKADTPAEAIRLRQELEQFDQAEAEYGELDLSSVSDERVRVETVWTPDVFWHFVRTIGPQQRTVVKALLEKPTGITSSELIERLTLQTEIALAGVLSGLSKQLKKMELKPAHLYSVNTTWGKGAKVREFVVQRAFELAAEELGWPEAERNMEHKKDAASTKQKRK